MQIFLNGEPRHTPDGARLGDLVASLELEGKRYAVEVNGELVPKSTHSHHPLQPGDKVEIVQAIGGG